MSLHNEERLVLERGNFFKSKVKIGKSSEKDNYNLKNKDNKISNGYIKQYRMVFWRHKNSQ